MSSTPLAVPVDKGSGGGAAGASTIPLVSICCLGILLLLLASTIILALIPIYVGTKTLNLSPNSKQYTTLNPSSSIPGYGDTSASACSTIGNAMGSAVGATGALSPSKCTFASTSGRRRRAWSVSRTRRQGGATLFMEIVISLDSCKRCRSKSHLKKWKGIKFTVSFFYFGDRTITFTISDIGTISFTGLSTEATPTTTAAPSDVTSPSASG